MAVDAKVLKRVGDLLRRAAPASGSSETERQIASLEAARLIAEHGLAVAEPPPPVRRRREAPSARPSRAPPAPRRSAWWIGSDWHEVIAYREHVCIMCSREIPPGESVFFDPRFGYRCLDITCDDAAPGSPR